MYIQKLTFNWDGSFPKFKYKLYSLMLEQKKQDLIFGFHSDLDIHKKKTLLEKLVHQILYFNLQN